MAVETIELVPANFRKPREQGRRETPCGGTEGPLRPGEPPPAFRSIRFVSELAAHGSPGSPPHPESTSGASTENASGKADSCHDRTRRPEWIGPVKNRSGPRTSEDSAFQPLPGRFHSWEGEATTRQVSCFRIVDSGQNYGTNGRGQRARDGCQANQTRQRTALVAAREDSVQDEPVGVGRRPHPVRVVHDPGHEHGDAGAWRET